MGVRLVIADPVNNPSVCPWPNTPTTTQVVRKRFPQYWQLPASSTCVSLLKGTLGPSLTRARNVEGFMWPGVTPDQWSVSNQLPAPVSRMFLGLLHIYFLEASQRDHALCPQWSLTFPHFLCLHLILSLCFLGSFPKSSSGTQILCLSLEAVVLEEHKWRHQAFHSQFFHSYISVSTVAIFRSTRHPTSQWSESAIG